MEISLVELKQKEEGKVKKIIAGKKCKQRLLDLGFIPDERVKMLSNGKLCPILVSIKGSEIALGRGLASRVMIERIKSKEKDVS